MLVVGALGARKADAVRMAVARYGATNQNPAGEDFMTAMRVKNAEREDLLGAAAAFFCSAAPNDLLALCARCSRSRVAAYARFSSFLPSLSFLVFKTAPVLLFVACVRSVL